MPPRRHTTDIQALAGLAISRRRFVAGGAAAFVASTLVPGIGHTANRLELEEIAANSLDTVTVPKGYSWHVVAS